MQPGLERNQGASEPSLSNKGRASGSQQPVVHCRVERGPQAGLLPQGRWWASAISERQTWTAEPLCQRSRGTQQSIPSRGAMRKAMEGMFFLQNQVHRLETSGQAPWSQCDRDKKDIQKVVLPSVALGQHPPELLLHHKEGGTIRVGILGKQVLPGELRKKISKAVEDDLLGGPELGKRHVVGTFEAEQKDAREIAEEDDPVVLPKGIVRSA